MNNLQCIVTDLDGSLLTKEKTISPADLATIKALKAKGVHFFIATGRHFSFAKQYVKNAGFDLPIACCNGAHVYDYISATTIMATPIPKDKAAAIKAELDRIGQAYIIYTTEKAIFNKSDSPRAQHWRKQSEKFDEDCKIPIYGADQDGFDINNYITLKFLVPYVAPPVKDRLNALLNADNSLSIIFSESDILDINVAGSSKGEGVRWLSKQYGFALENTLVLGDNFNDESMLKICGYPVATSNAEDDIKAIARYVTTNHNNDPLTNAVQALFPQMLD